MVPVIFSILVPRIHLIQILPHLTDFLTAFSEKDQNQAKSETATVNLYEIKSKLQF